MVVFTLKSFLKLFKCKILKKKIVRFLNEINKEYLHFLSGDIIRQIRRNVF